VPFISDILMRVIAIDYVLTTRSSSFHKIGESILVVFLFFSVVSPSLIPRESAICSSTVSHDFLCMSIIVASEQYPSGYKEYLHLHTN
jgi:hypothetical protein